MKTYKSSDLTHKRAEVLKEAAENGVIIQQLETNGEVRQEFVLLPLIDNQLKLNINNGDGELFDVNGYLLGKGDLWKLELKNKLLLAE